MRVLLQDGMTGKFFVAPDVWTKDPTKALGFQNGAEVIRLAVNNKVEKGNLYYSFGNPKVDFSIPIDSRADRTSASVNS